MGRGHDKVGVTVGANVGGTVAVAPVNDGLRKNTFGLVDTTAPVILGVRPLPHPTLVATRLVMDLRRPPAVKAAATRKVTSPAVRVVAPHSPVVGMALAFVAKDTPVTTVGVVLLLPSRVEEVRP